MRAYGILVTRGSTDINDIIAQRGNVTDSMKLCNTKLHVVGHYFCCTIPWAAYCGGGGNASVMPCIVLVLYN